MKKHSLMANSWKKKKKWTDLNPIDSKRGQVLTKCNYIKAKAKGFECRTQPKKTPLKHNIRSNLKTLTYPGVKMLIPLCLNQCTVTRNLFYKQKYWNSWNVLQAGKKYRRNFIPGLDQFGRIFRIKSCLFFLSSFTNNKKPSQLILP